MAVLETPADKFEYRIQKLLRNLGFEHVDGGADFFIGGRQVDAAGAFEGDVYIFECTTQTKNHEFKISQHTLVRTPKISAALEKVNVSSVISLRKDITKKIRESENQYRKYIKKGGKIYWIYSVNNNSLRDQDKNLAKENDIRTLGLEEIKYFEDLAQSIPSRAGYEFLAHLAIPAPAMLEMKLPAFKFQFNNLLIYQFFARPYDIVKISSVARREINAPDFYQRMITSSRLSDIHKYVDEGNFIPTNVIVALTGKITFSPAKLSKDFEKIAGKSRVEVGSLTLPANYSTCIIIDGQHRLFSFDENDISPLSFVAFENISMQEQMKYFVDINDNAKKIDTSLMWDLWSDLRPDDKFGITSKAAKRLNQTGILNGKIKYPGNKDGLIALREVCDALIKASLTDKQLKSPSKGHLENPLSNQESDKFAQSVAYQLSNFLKNVTDDYREFVKEFVISPGGLYALVQLYGILLWESKNRSLNNPVNDIAKTLGRNLETAGELKLHEWRRLSAGGYSGREQILERLINLIESDENVLRDYLQKKNTKILEYEKTTERLLITYIVGNIKSQDTDLLKKYIGPNKVEHALRICPPNPEFKDIVVKTYFPDKMDAFFGILSDSSAEKQSKFIRVYDRNISSNDRRFKDMTDLKKTLMRLHEFRNRNDDHHPQLEYENITDDEKRMLETWYERLITCLESSIED